MKFLIDAQLPPKLCDWLGDRGHRAVHVNVIGLGAADDQAIAALAEREGLVIVSKDEDFLRIHLPDRFALVWLRCGNTTNEALAEWLVPRWEQIIALLKDHERMIEVK
jgi:predicted nuclease of predicted toxin-antitoxin system